MRIDRKLRHQPNVGKLWPPSGTLHDKQRAASTATDAELARALELLNRAKDINRWARFALRTAIQSEIKRRKPRHILSSQAKDAAEKAIAHIEGRAAGPRRVR